MKILLIGEYSRLHNSLKEGLAALGHEVKIVGTGDAFKGFPVDFSIAPKIVSDHFLWKIFNKIWFRFFRTDLSDYEKGWRFKKLLPELKDFDVVQLINSNAIEAPPYVQIRLYEKLFSQNKNVFLLICGEDTPIVEELLKDNLKYSILTPLFKNPKLRKTYFYTLKYTSKPYKKLYDFVASNSDGLIVSDLDYKIPMDLQNIETTLIPNPINTDKIAFIPNKIEDKIVIFHGINTLSADKKGSVFFTEALKKIDQKYGNKVKIINANNIPYAQYIGLYDSAHIVLDQVYGYDQGYNALEAMAKGKVVFTGAESEFYDHYQLSQAVNINAVPDVSALVEKLSYLIDNPNDITEIGQRARNFIEKEHYYKTIAQKYLDFWHKKIRNN